MEKEPKKRSFNKEHKNNNNLKSDRKFSRSTQRDSEGGNDRKFSRSTRRDSEGGNDRKFSRSTRRDSEGGNDRKFSRSTRRDSQNNFNKDSVVKKRKRNITAESKILTEIVEKRRQEGRVAPQKQKLLSLEYEEQHGPIRLNKYISNSGICSRRDADMLITSGAILVNGKVVTELGTKVLPTDEIKYENKILQREKPVYVLLNKPKDYITTSYDEKDRKDVMILVKDACKERIYPVGRLDRNTTGVLLFTNDGELAKKLTHPKFNIKKTYLVELDKKLSAQDFEAIIAGIELNDGPVKVDELAYVGDTKKAVGITIHSGRNRIVRRIFEYFSYDIIKLDRVVFAGLNKKNVPRGKWRFLTPSEINILKML